MSLEESQPSPTEHHWLCFALIALVLVDKYRMLYLTIRIEDLGLCTSYTPVTS